MSDLTYYIATDCNTLFIAMAVEDMLKDILPSPAQAQQVTDSKIHCLINEIDEHDMLELYDRKYSIPMSNLFYLIYYGQIEVTKDLFKEHDRFLAPATVTVINNPFINMNEINFTWELMWTLYQCERRIEDDVTKVIQKYHKRIFNTEHAYDSFARYPDGFIGVEIDRKTMRHKQVCYPEITGHMFNETVRIFRSI
jgi:hypothetical protein